MIKIKGYKILNNIYLLYVVFFITILNLFSFMYNKNYKSVILFSFITLFVYIFNKNMIIILLSALIVTNSFNLFTVEGYTNKKIKKVNKSIDNEEDETDKKDDEHEEYIPEDDGPEGYINNYSELDNDESQNKLKEEIVKKLGNIVIDQFINKDISNNLINTPGQTLQEEDIKSAELQKKLQQVSGDSPPIQPNPALINPTVKSDNKQPNEIYNKIYELNNKINELTNLIK
jgi:hypothetical protein